MVDVSHFEPNEISVKTTDKDIIVHGMITLFVSFWIGIIIWNLLNTAKHEERKGQFGSVSRE
jgi:hypothetical protein